MIATATLFVAAAHGASVTGPMLAAGAIVDILAWGFTAGAVVERGQ